jgi:predicted enzyme related to lactoylglutathione lyase
MHESLPNTIDYIEMLSRKLTETKRFFSGLFGWSFEDYGPDYSAFDDGRMAGGSGSSSHAVAAPARSWDRRKCVCRGRRCLPGKLTASPTKIGN